MSDATCPSCYRPQHDGLLCAVCTKHLTDDLTALPGDMAELKTTHRRQARQTDGTGGKSHDAPLPYDHTAATVRDSVTNTVGTWIRELDLGDFHLKKPACTCEPPKAKCAGYIVAPVPATMGAWCGWLIERTERIRGHLAAAEIVDEIHYAATIARQAVDRTGDAVYCGTCEICGKRLYASPDRDTVTCRWCWIGDDDPGDKYTYTVPGKQAGAWKQAEDRLLTRAQLLEALVYNAAPVNAATFRSWIHRGRLAPAEHRRSGTPLYRLGDALALARAAALTPDQTKETMTG